MVTEELLFYEILILDPAARSHAADLCSVPFHSSEIFTLAAKEYRATASYNTPRLRPVTRKPVAPSIAVTATPEAQAARARLRAAHGEAFDKGFRAGALGFHETGGYPRDFAQWPAARRDAWFSGNYAGLAAARTLEVAA